MVTIGIIDTAPNDFHIIAFPPYCRSVEGSGANYRVLDWTLDEQQLDDYISTCDGFVFTGGDDIDPSHYGEEILPEFLNEMHLNLPYFPKCWKAKSLCLVFAEDANC